MDYDTDKADPLPISELLIQQVEEQSDLCDFIVKVGTWEKRFHRNVLVASPFFKNMFTHNYIEKQKGMVEIPVGTPETVEMTLMFLYGKKPAFCLDSVRNIVELADFLLIDHLKASLVKWLEQIDITEENCLTLLKTCTDFGVNLRNLNNFIEGHLPGLFLQKAITIISEDTVRYILTETKLSYVQTDDKIRFIIKWINGDQDNRRHLIDEFLEYIDLSEVSEQLVDDIKADLDIGFPTLAKNMLVSKKTRDVIIILPNLTCRHCLWCFEPSSSKWYKLYSTALKDFKRLCGLWDFEMSGDPTSPTLYLSRRLTGNQVHCLDLSTDTVITGRLSPSEENITDLDTLKFPTYHDGQIFACTQGLIMLNAAVNVTYDNNIPSFMQPSAPLDVTQNMLVPIKYATVYKGQVGPVTPLFTMRNFEMDKVCINDESSMILHDLNGSKCAIFDINDHTLEILTLDFIIDDPIYPTKDGFAFFNMSRLVFVTRRNGSFLASKYRVKQLNLEAGIYPDFVRYNFCGGLLFREQLSASKIQMATYDNISSTESFSSVIWNDFVLPEKVTCRSDDILDHVLIKTRFPKDKLRCDIDCPHCDIDHKTETDNSDDDSEDSDEEDSFSDEFYDTDEIDSSDEDNIEYGF